MPVVNNDLKLCVNHQFIAPSLYNQITQLVFVTDIFRPRIKCTTLFGGTLGLCEVSHFRSRLSPNGFQVIRLGRETIFVGLPGRCSLSSRVSSSLARVFSFAHYFQASASQAIQIGDTEREVIIRKVIERSYFKKQDLYFFFK